MKTSTNFTTRRSTIDDAPLFYDVIEQTMREFIIATWGRWNESRVRQESLDDSVSPHAQVIQIGDIGVGVLLVERFPTHIQLEQLYLLPEYQHMGIGSALIDGLITESSGSQVPIRLRVMAVNPAKQFYEKFGFIVTEVTPEFFLMEKVT
jgi:ribosomal protein S18 acetylase RimI-like enzyme